MASFGISLLMLACVFGGALTGMLLGRVLPSHHLGDETRNVLTLASGTLSVLSALVIGLLMSYAKGDFDAQTTRSRALPCLPHRMSMLERWSLPVSISLSWLHSSEVRGAKARALMRVLSAA
jgi:hypothetical protein